MLADRSSKASCDCPSPREQKASRCSKVAQPPCRSGVNGIGCYICSSKNGSDPYCEDPFHPGHSTYASSCQVGKKNHIGRFPANFCVKITGQSTRTGVTLMIRICVLENMDSQCGLFKFENEELSGCILTCNDDGCNPANTLRLSPLMLSASFLSISYILNSRF
ncbi:uncharacterized protein LOC108667146 isoform X2 [Hyalella azteca]|nr:uncharacterized protein LOC108667146 isoform X2 [Hyalella azteca]